MELMFGCMARVVANSETCSNESGKGATMSSLKNELSLGVEVVSIGASPTHLRTPSTSTTQSSGKDRSRFGGCSYADGPFPSGELRLRIIIMAGAWTCPPPFIEKNDLLKNAIYYFSDE